MAQPAAARPDRVRAFLDRTPPEVVSAMWKVAGKAGNAAREELTPEERIALDAWLQPRLDALVERWAQAIEHGDVRYSVAEPRSTRAHSRALEAATARTAWR